MTFYINKLHKDILVKLNEEKLSQTALSEKLNICRPTILTIGNGFPPKIKTFIKLLNWLNKDANTYIK